MRRYSTWFTVFFLLTAFLALPSFADTNYVVNQAGGGNFTDLNTCLTDINAGADTIYTVQFTDAAAVTYTLNPGEQTIRNGVKLTFTAATAGIVSINGRFNAANGGGTLTASNIHFYATGQWCIIHAYDGIFFTNCSFGPSGDNGVIIRGGVDNLFQDCTFDGITNGAIRPTGGTSSANNCTWQNGRYCVASEGTGNSTGLFTVNGGTATGNHTAGPAFILSAFFLRLNNVTTTGFGQVIQRDWEADLNIPAWAEANNCSFTGVYDRAITSYINNEKISSITCNHCTIEGRPDAGADLVVIDGRGNNNGATITLNSCVLRTLSQTAGTAVNCWAGGTINLNNTVIDGCTNTLLLTSQDSGYDVNLNVNHCVIVNNRGATLACGDYPNETFNLRNTIVDSSNAGDINLPEQVTRVVQNNCINAGTYMGDNAVTGDPKFVNAAAGDYHIQAGSVCAGAGVLTDLLVDVDGEVRPQGGTAPDIGIDEIITTEVPNWELY
jgi:hypothetical protein